MTLRKVPGTLALGLLASLAAHAVVYGGDHTMGGGYHALLVQAASAVGIGLLVFFGALAWIEADAIADGSIVATRLREKLPSFRALLVSTAGWFAAAEAVEPHHASAAPIAIAFALTAAAWLFRVVARGLVDILARAVITIAQAAFAARVPSWNRRERIRPIARRALWARRRYARPPPIVA